METQQQSIGEPTAERGGPVGKHQPKPARRWWHVIGSLLLAVLAVFLVFAAVIVNVQHWKLEPVLSGSMRPGIQPGDLAVVRPVPLDDIHVGTIIAYQPPNEPRPVLHRIVEMDGKTILTKGDANNVADPWGKVTLQSGNVDRLVGVVPKVGFLLDVRSLLLKIFGGIIIAAAALWIVALIRDHKKSQRDSAAQAENAHDDDAADSPSAAETTSVAGSPGRPLPREPVAKGGDPGGD